VGAEGSWHEGPGSSDITIRYNRIIRCGAGSGSIAGASGIAADISGVVDTVAGIHKRLLIEGNIIEGFKGAACGIYIGNSEKVDVRYNVIVGCNKAVKVAHSRKVNVTDNTDTPDRSIFQNTIPHRKNGKGKKTVKTPV